MSQLSKIPPSALEKLSPEKHKSIVLNELKREDVIAHIAGLLHDAAKLYQIPNWGVTESVNLAGWILRTYKYEQLETINHVLSNPPVLDTTQRIFRLTPDIIREWLSIELDRRVQKTEQTIHNEPFKELAPLKEEEKQEGVPDEWEDERLTEWLKTIEKVEAKKIPPLTKADIMREGQEKPMTPKASYTDEEYHVLQQLKMKYGKEYCDLYTGKPKPGAPSFEEFLKLQTE